MKYKIGDKVKINTPSCATQPYNIGERLLGKIGTVIWVKDFENPLIQGVCVLVDGEKEITSAWSYSVKNEFILIEKAIDYCKICALKYP